MNERIRLLAEKAGITEYPAKLSVCKEDDGTISTKYEYPLEKFAQLIEQAAEKKYFSAGYIAGQSDGISETVRACVDIVNGLSQHQGPGDCSTAEYIREHFGVEQ